MLKNIFPRNKCCFNNSTPQTTERVTKEKQKNRPDKISIRKNITPNEREKAE